MNYDTFKHEVSVLKAYKKSLRQIEEEMEDIIYQYCGVKGIRYDREPSIRNVAMEEATKLKMSEALAEPQREYDFTLMAIQRIERHLSMLTEEVREMCIMHYVEGYSLVYVGDAFGYSPSRVLRIIKSEVAKI